MNKRADGRPAGIYDAGGYLRVDTQGNNIAYDAGGEAHIHLNGQDIGPPPRPVVEVRMLNCQCGCGKAYVGVFIGGRRVHFVLEEVDGLLNLDGTLPKWLTCYGTEMPDGRNSKE